MKNLILANSSDETYGLPSYEHEEKWWFMSVNLAHRS
jgi:hypothetical protein